VRRKKQNAPPGLALPDFRSRRRRDVRGFSPHTYTLWFDEYALLRGHDRTIIYNAFRPFLRARTTLCSSISEECSARAVFCAYHRPFATGPIINIHAVVCDRRGNRWERKQRSVYHRIFIVVHAADNSIGMCF